MTLVERFRLVTGPIRDRLHVTARRGVEQAQADARMPASARSKQTRDKVKAHRERLRRQGLRPI